MKALLRSQRGIRPLLLVGALLTGCDSETASQAHLARAQEALQAGELRTAVIEFKNVLQSNPEDPVARALLGQALARQENAVAAMAELERAQELGADLELVQPWLAGVWLEAGEYANINQLNLDDVTTSSLHAQLLGLQARALLAVGDIDAAVAKATSALAADETLPEVKLAMAQARFAQEDFQETRDFLDQILATEPANGEANLLLGELERRQGNPKAAEAAFSAAMQDRWIAPRARLNRAYTRIQLEDFEGAREDIAQLRETLRDSPLVDYAEGLLLYTQNQYRTAINRLDAALGASPNLLPALRLAGATQLALEKPKLARIHLERFLSQQPEDAGAQRMLAMALLQTGEAKPAEQVARELIARNSEDVAAMDLLASALMMQGKRKEGTDYLRQVKAMAPSSPELDTRLGLALLDQGEKEEGLQLLRDTAEQNPESANAVEKLVTGLARSGDSEEALNTAVVYQQQHADSAHAHTLVAAVHLQRGDIEQAKAAFGRALDIEPGYLPASKALAALATQAEDYASASDILEASLSHHPQDLDVLIALTKLALAQEDPPSAKTYLDQALEAHPDNITPKLYLAAYLLRQGDAKEALSFTADAIAMEPDNRAALGLRADAQLALEDYRAARGTLQALVERLDQPSPRVLWALARTYLALGQIEDAKGTLEQVHAADPNFTPALLALGRLAIQRQDIAAATDYLDELKQQLGNNQRDVLLIQSDLARLQGDLAATEEAFHSLIDAETGVDFDQDSALWGVAEQLVLTFIREGDPEAGLEAATQLTNRQPDSARSHALLGLLYLRNQKPEEAAAAFEQALQLDPANITATNGLVSMAVQEQDYDQAQALYAAALEKTPSDLSLLIGSARLALLRDDPQAAESFLLTSVERNPQSAAAKLYLGALYLGQGQAEKTLELVTDSGLDIDQNPRLLALKAEAEIALGRFRSASGTLQDLNRLQPDQPRVLLTLANTQARLGQTRLAKESLTQALRLDPNSIPALRGLARLALTDDAPEEARQHIEAMRKILGPEHNDVLQLEGRLAEKTGDLDLALAKYRVIFQQSPNSTTVLLMAGILTRQDKIDAARQVMTDWLTENPKDNRVRFALAQLELNRGTPEGAIQEYQALVDSGIDNPVVLNNLAWLLKDTAPDQALAYARQAHEAAPESADIADTLAVLLLEQNAVGEARQLIDIAVAAQPGNLSMLFHKALILQKQGETAEARLLVEGLLENPAPFPERDDAERWLNQHGADD